MNSFEECINSGNMSFNKGDLLNANIAFTKAINYALSIDDKVMAYWNRSWAYAKAGDAVNTVADLDEVLQLYPNHNDARQSLINFSNDEECSNTVREMAIRRLNW